MIPAKQLLSELDRRLHRVDSEYSGTLSVQQKDSYLNEGLIVWFENRVALSKVNSAIRNDLRQFEKKKVRLSPSKEEEDCAFFKFPEGYYQLLRQRAYATKGDCPERKLIVHIVSNDDLEESLINPDRSPSYDWEETLADEAGDGLYVFHNGDFEINSLEIDYYKKPSRIYNGTSAPGGFYIDATGRVIDFDQGLEIDSTYAWRKIVDIAALAAQRDLSDFPEYQSQVSKILTENTIHKTQ